MASNRLQRKIGIVVLLGMVAACSGKPSVAPTSAVSSMQSVELKAGAGDGVTAGKIAVVQYTGWLYEASAPDHKGKQFDSSRTAGSSSRRTSHTAIAAPAASFRRAQPWYSTSNSSPLNEPAS
jgi:hypothetical protein